MKGVQVRPFVPSRAMVQVKRVPNRRRRRTPLSGAIVELDLKGRVSSNGCCLVANGSRSVVIPLVGYDYILFNIIYIMRSLRRWLEEFGRLPIVYA